MNWGTSIALVYGAFVALLLTLVFASAQEDFHLVREDYYAAELAHEDRLEQIRNLQELGASVDVAFIPQSQELRVALPANTDVIQGSVWLYRPSDSRQDRHFDLASDQADVSYLIATNDLNPGLWRVQTEWKASNGKAYWQEHTLVLP